MTHRVARTTRARLNLMFCALALLLPTTLCFAHEDHEPYHWELQRVREDLVAQMLMFTGIGAAAVSGSWIISKKRAVEK